jgi:hypothetical protein
MEIALLAAILGALGLIAFMLVFTSRFTGRSRKTGFSTVVFTCWMIGTVILTPYTFAFRVPGFPDMSIERVLFVLTLFLGVIRFYSGNYLKRQDMSIEIVMSLFCLICLISMSRFGFMEIYGTLSRPSFVFMIGYAVPLVAFVFVKRFLVTEEDFQTLCKMFFWFGCYLVLIAYLERFDIKSLVFPKYIVDATISEMHLDRSRGPFMNAAFNGLCINIAFIFGLMALPLARGPVRLVHIVLLLLYLPAIYFTRTRSVYLHFLLTMFVVMFVYKSQWARWKFLPVVLVLGMAAVLLNWERLASSDREAGGIGQMKEVDIRLALADKSLRLMLEHPFGGVGLTQFQQASLFTPGEVEQQHNHIIGIAVELGLPGLFLWLTVLGMLLTRLYRLAEAVPDGRFININFILLLATAIFTNLFSNVFVEPALHLFANMNLFMFAGIVDQLYNRYCLGGGRYHGVSGAALGAPPPAGAFTR